MAVITATGTTSCRTLTIGFRRAEARSGEGTRARAPLARAQRVACKPGLGGVTKADFPFGEELVLAFILNSPLSSLAR
jgi:hypothetical protein